MSINRRGRNKGATRRSYLKVIQGGGKPRFDKNPDDIVKDVRGSNRNLSVPTPNHGRATTTYEVLVEDEEGKIKVITRQTPINTMPEIAAKKAMHRALQGLPTEYRYKLVDTPLRKVWLVYNVLGTRHTYWIIWLDPLTGIEKESITYATKDSAMRHFKLNSITWR